MADAVIADPGVPPQILDRARADAARLTHPHPGAQPEGMVVRLLGKNI
jgi:uroporphyrin-III C-methyltransferase/precorrin-2 dehydrogenase/sirohydrochlorin ferrochelatase